MRKNKAVIDRFDLDTRMLPVWDGDTVYNESVMFVGVNDRVKLLYDPSEIISVRSKDLKTEYVKGVDYDVDDEGFLVLLPGTSAVFIPEDLYYSFNAEVPEVVIKVLRDGAEAPLYFSEEISKYQIFVTYRHEPAPWLFIPPVRRDAFKKLIGKLEAGEDVTMVFYGDSITFGASSSSLFNCEPFEPIWPVMFTEYLADRYSYTVNYVDPKLPNTASVPSGPSLPAGRSRGTVTYVNTAVGGWSSRNAADSFDLHVAPFVEKYGCDFFLFGFGMNDGLNDTDTQKGLVKATLDRMTEAAPQCELLLLSTMVPNPDSVNGWYARQELFEDVYYELADHYTRFGHPAAVAPMTSVSKSMLCRKRFRDYTGNNINHPNDFMAAVYAQTVMQTVAGC